MSKAEIKLYILLLFKLCFIYVLLCRSLSPFDILAILCSNSVWLLQHRKKVQIILFNFEITFGLGQKTVYIKGENVKWQTKQLIKQFPFTPWPSPVWIISGMLIFFRCTIKSQLKCTICVRVFGITQKIFKHVDCTKDVYFLKFSSCIAISTLKQFSQLVEFIFIIKVKYAVCIGAGGHTIK